MRNVVVALMSVLFCIAFVMQVSAQDLQAAPDFTLRDVEGQRVSLEELTANGPVLLDFWATWCVPCKQGLPHLAQIYEDHKDNGFVLAAVSIDNQRSVGRVRPYARSQGWEFPVLLDTDSEVLRRYQGNNVPHTVLVNQDREIVRVWIGYHAGEEAEIREEVERLLAQGGAE